MAKDKKVTHIGLTIVDHAALEAFMDRVERFNKKHEGLYVNMVANWTERPVPHCPEPHYDILLEYENKDVANKFWKE